MEMKKIKPDIKKRMFLGVGGIVFLVIGLFLFPTSIFKGYFEILPLLVSSTFIVFGVLSIYYSWLYEIIIDDNGVSAGNYMMKKEIFKEQIEGYFLIEELTERREKINVLVLLLANGNKKRFDSEYLGQNFKILKKEISNRYKLLPLEKEANYLTENKKNGFQWASYIGLGVFLFGVYLLIGSFNPNFELIEIKGSLKEKPSFQFNRYKRLSRINVKLIEFPNHTFSQVKNVQRFENWANEAQLNDEIIIEVSKESYDKKILNTIEPDKVILNYDMRTIEIKRLRSPNNQYVYKENRFEDISLPLFIMAFGIGSFIYYYKKKKLAITKHTTVMPSKSWSRRVCGTLCGSLNNDTVSIKIQRDEK